MSEWGLSRSHAPRWVVLVKEVIRFKFLQDSSISNVITWCTHLRDALLHCNQDVDCSDCPHQDSQGCKVVGVRMSREFFWIPGSRYIVSQLKQLSFAYLVKHNNNLGKFNWYKEIDLRKAIFFLQPSKHGCCSKSDQSSTCKVSVYLSQ